MSQICKFSNRPILLLWNFPCFVIINDKWNAHFYWSIFTKLGVLLIVVMSQALSEWTKLISGKVSKGWISELFFNSIINFKRYNLIVKQQQKTMCIFVFGTDYTGYLRPVQQSEHSRVLTKICVAGMGKFGKRSLCWTGLWLMFSMIVIIYMLTWKDTYKDWTNLSLSNLQASM